MDGHGITVAGGDVMAHVHTAAADGFGASVAMWFGMMAAMMAPTAWPWVRAFHRFGGPERAGVAATAQFAAGYLFTWFWYSVAAAALQLVVHVPKTAAPIILLVAGAYQFAPLKRACLTHCRSPFSFFLARWHDGPAGGFRLGVQHGIFCLGCCWALMVTPIAVGLMNLWWMAALAAIALFEQTAPRGDRLRVPVGVALIAAAAWQLRTIV